jgi:hypothetical protein
VGLTALAPTAQVNLAVPGPATTNLAKNPPKLDFLLGVSSATGVTASSAAPSLAVARVLQVPGAAVVSTGTLAPNLVKNFLVPSSANLALQGGLPSLSTNAQCPSPTGLVLGKPAPDLGVGLNVPTAISSFTCYIPALSVVGLNIDLLHARTLIAQADDRFYLFGASTRYYLSGGYTCTNGVDVTVGLARNYTPGADMRNYTVKA